MFSHTMSKEYHLQCPCYVPVMSMLGWVSVFWDLNSLPHIFQTKSQIIIANFGSFSYFDPIQASVCLRLTLKLCLETWRQIICNNYKSRITMRSCMQGPFSPQLYIQLIGWDHDGRKVIEARGHYCCYERISLTWIEVFRAKANLP